MAKPKKPKTPKSEKPGESRSLIWLQGLACGVLAAIAPGIALGVGGLVAPGLIALKLDKDPGRPVARTVLTFGLAGSVHPMLTLWNAGQSVDAALAILTDPAQAGPAWAAAACGWLIAQIAPLGVRAALEAAALTRAARLRAARDALIEAWGLDPSEGQ